MTDDDQPPEPHSRLRRAASPPSRRSPGGGRRSLRVRLGDARGRPIDAPELASWLSNVAPRAACGYEVSVALVSDGFMRTLNHRFRGMPRVTDVLSFPAEPVGQTRHAGKVRDAPPRMLGDIVIATGVARRHARSARHSYDIEVRVLALHGLLHLLGYDHETDAGQMARTESRLRRRAGLPVGLIERGAHP
jgi:probable rRNA maturation factor